MPAGHFIRLLVSIVTFGLNRYAMRGKLTPRRIFAKGVVTVKLIGALLLAGVLTFSQEAVAQSADIFSVSYIQQHLKKGVTTPDEVVKAFGEPHSRDGVVSSEGPAQETFVYMKGGNKPAKSGRGLGGLLGVARGVLGDVTRATGKSSFQADRALGGAANVADRVSTVAPAESETKRVTLSISFTGGVVKSFEMR